MIQNGKCIKIKIDKSNEKTAFEAHHDNQHHYGAFSELLGFGFKDDYHIEPNEKLYFGFIIPNDYSYKDVMDKFLNIIRNDNLKI